MQHAAINFRHENIQIFPELFSIKGVQEKEENQHTSSNYFGFERNSTETLNSFYDWEYFCNELEYE